MKGANKPVSLFKQNAGQKPPNQLTKQQNLWSRHHIPSYVEIDPNQLIVVQPIPLRHSAQDNDMWARIKFQMLPTQQLDSPFRHSSSSSTLTSCSSTDYYSPLPDFSLGVESSEMLVPHHPFTSWDHAHSLPHPLTILSFLLSFLSPSLHPSVPFLLPPFHRDSIIPASALNNQTVHLKVDHSMQICVNTHWQQVHRLLSSLQHIPTLP